MLTLAADFTFIRFQEQLLPKRSIVFVNDQMYWRCRFSEWSEGTNLDLSPTAMETTSATLFYDILDENIDTIESYDTIILYYSRRKLTFEADILNAATGLLRRLEIRMATRFFYGLPRSAFDFAILFLASSNESKDCISHRRPEFPSYSWAGWRNEIHHPGSAEIGSLSAHAIDANTWLAERTWIIWHEIDVSGGTNLVWNAEVEALATNAELHIRYPVRRSLARFRRFTPFSSDFPTKPRPTWEKPPRPYSLIGFWTMVVFLEVRETNYSTYTEEWIYDCNNEAVGVACLKCDLDLKTGCQIEFLLVSEITLPYVRHVAAWPSHWLEMTDEELRERGRKGSAPEWSCFWALAVMEVNGCMERIGVARISQSVLRGSYAPGPIWRECFLA